MNDRKIDSGTVIHMVKIRKSEELAKHGIYIDKYRFYLMDEVCGVAFLEVADITGFDSSL